MAKNKIKQDSTLAEPKTMRLEKDRDRERIANVKSIGEIPLKTYEMKRNAFVGIKK